MTVSRPQDSALQDPAYPKDVVSFFNEVNEKLRAVGAEPLPVGQEGQSERAIALAEKLGTQTVDRSRYSMAVVALVAAMITWAILGGGWGSAFSALLGAAITLAGTEVVYRERPVDRAAAAILRHRAAHEN